ncbi:MAG: signal peptidase II [Lachnospiraceae bacterium]|nr:signal peptidase II [Lachnospiraceae bacterium]
MNTKIHYLKHLLLTILLVALDQYTKSLAVAHLRGKPSHVLMEGVLELTYVENFGAAFGILQNAQVLFILITCVAVILICFVLIKMPLTRRMAPAHLLLTLILAGACGNLIDRIRTVYVVDFIYFSLIDFPVFNVADICVTTACVLLIILGIVYFREEDFAFLQKTPATPGTKEDAESSGGSKEH